MADSENNLQVGVIVETAGLTTGTAQVSEAVEQMAARIKLAFGSVERAPEGVQNAFAVMKNSSRQSAQVVTDAVNSLNQALTVVPPKAAAAGSSIDRAMQTAAARIFVTEAGLGRMGLALSRVGIAAGALGPLFTAAFPVLAAVGVVTLIENMIKKFKELEELSAKTAHSVLELTEQIDTQSESLDIENDRLDIQIAKLEHKPTNELGLIIDENIKKLRDLGRETDTDLAKLIKLFEEGPGFFSAFAGLTKINLSAVGAALGPLQLQYDMAVAARDVDAEKNVLLKAQQTIQAAITAEAQRQKDVIAANAELQQRSVLNARVRPPALDTKADTTNLFTLDLALKAVNVRLADFDKLKEQAGKRTTVGGLEQKKEQAELAKKTAAEQKENLKEYLKMLDEEVEKKALAAKSQGGGTYAEEFENEMRAANEMFAMKQRLYHEDQEAAKKAIAEQSRISDETLHAALDTAKFAMEIDDSRFEHQHKMGEINEQQMIALKKKALSDELAAETAALNQRMAVIDSNDPDSPAKRKKIYDELLKLQQQYNLASQKLDQTSAEVRRKEFEKLFGEINRPMEGALKEVIMGSERVGKAFRHMGAEIVSSITQSLAMAAVKWAEHWALLELLTVTGNASIAAAQGLANSKKVFSDAYTAAANAYAAVPFPLNLVVAPTVFTLVAALGSGAASAAGGMVVPSDDMMAFLHKNEVVLPASIAKRFTDAAPGGGGGGEIHVHMHNHFIDGKDAQNFLDKHSTRISRTIGKKLRGMGVGSR